MTLRNIGDTIAVLSILCTVSPAPAAGPDLDFARDVAPLLERACVRCHYSGNAKGDVSLATAADLLDGGHLVPGKPGESGLFELVEPAAGGKRPRMPKDGKPLAPAEVALLRRWVTEGAVWPAGVTLKERAKADRSWWSLRPLADVAPPNPAGFPAGWAANPVDRFVFAKLAEKGLSPNPPADPRALVRRVSYDLTGLPPPPERVEAFARDPSPEAYAQLVDEFLASPAYGERWGRHWLDVVRFGESTGFERNVILDSAWPFRDYVIASFNADKPFDRLIREHLAGDVVGAGDPAAETGTGFLVCGPYDNVGNKDAAQAAVIRADTLDEVIRATGEAFLGVTVGCARCHDHKFDPILAADYYRLYATFAGVTHGTRTVAPAAEKRNRATKLAALKRERDALAAVRVGLLATGADPAHLDRELARVTRAVAAVPPLPEWWVGRFHPAPGPIRVFLGGDPRRPGDPVTAGSPTFLADAAKGYDLPAAAPEADRRLALANWLIAPDNPLPPRVLANRVWHYHFGTGIVDTPSDFGYMGGRPTHPELLDWLARQLRADGWRLKPLHRLIVTSETYRQSSIHRPEAAAIDGDARLLWRFPPRRLSGEEVRDSMLAVAGKLDPKMGGPGFRLYRYVEDNVATYVPLDAPGPDTYRRAVYHQNARAARVDVLTDFDCPDPATASPRRASTTTPLQALTLFNHRFTLDMADALAARAGAGGGDPVRRAFGLAFGRPPTPAEAEAAGRVAAAHGLRAVCRALLNSNEFLYLD